MNLLLFKSEDQLIKEGISRLDKTELGGAGSSGKVARLLLNIINSIIAGEGGVYEALSINHANAFLSTAEGEGLDALGTLFNLYRISGESDNEYRYRISQATTGMATANIASIRLAALSVEGVQEVVLKEYSYGAGSYSVYIITESATPSDSMIYNVTNSISAVKPYGVRFSVVYPIVLDTELNMVVSFIPTISEVDKNLIETNIKALILEHINSKSMGSSLVIKELIDIARLHSNLIKDVYISSIKINGVSVFITDQKARWNQRFLASSRIGAINIQGVI